MLVRLEVAHQKANVKKVVLKSDAVIGRSADCNLRIASSEISRRHCRLTLNETGVFVRDLESSNGTFVDGNRIEPNIDVALQPACELSLGGIRFLVHFKPPHTVEDPGSTVDLPFVMSETPPPESDAEIDAPASADRNDAEGRTAGDETIMEAAPGETAGDSDNRGRVNAGIDNTVFAADLAEADTVQTSAPDAPAFPPAAESDAGWHPETVNQFANAAGEDTIDMRFDELEAAPSDEQNQAGDSAGGVNAEAAAAEGEEERPPAKSWSLFGMFKRKNNAAAQPAATPGSAGDEAPVASSLRVEPAPAAPAVRVADLDETIFEPLDRPGPDATVKESEPDAVAEAETPATSEDDSAAGHSVPDTTAPDEATPEQAGPEKAGPEKAGPEEAAPAETAPDEAASADDDEALGDFLRNLS